MTNTTTSVTISPEQEARFLAMRDTADEIESLIRAYNEGLAAGLSSRLQTKIGDDLVAAEKTYAAQSLRDFCLRCLVRRDDGSTDQAKTIINALTWQTYDVIKHTKDSDSGILKREDKTADVTLDKLCSICQLNTDWVAPLEAYNKSMALRVGKKIGLSTEEIKEIDGSYRMSKLAQELEDGHSPITSTQMSKKLQAIVDKIVFVPGDNNPQKNRIVIENRDINRLDLVYATRKADLKTASANISRMKILVTDMLIRIINDRGYTMVYPRKKSK